MSDSPKLFDTAGGRLESSGEFTLSPSKAREKLAKSLLESPSDCLLKLVQAAVSDNASSIQISISRYGFKLQAHGTGGDAPSTLEELDAGELLSHPLGLAAQSLTHAGAEVVYDATRSSRWSLEATFPRGFLASLVDGLKERAALHKALHRCRFSPVPIRLGGRDIIDPYPDRTTRPFFQKPIGACLVSQNFSLYERYEVHSGAARDGFRCVPGSRRQAFARHPDKPGGPTLNAETGAFRNPSLQGAVLLHETVGGVGPLFLRALRIPLHLRGGSHLTVIDRGVALETEEIYLSCPGVEVVESLGDLNTDLSGLKLVRDDRLSARRTELNEWAHQGVLKIKQSLKLLPRFSGKHSNVCHLRRYIKENLPF